MLARLALPDPVVSGVRLLNKDSLEMTPEDHAFTAAAAHRATADTDGVVIVHGTDRRAVSGEATCALQQPRVAIVFTGAMRRYELRNADAMQNLTEALAAVRLVAPGAYVVMDNKVLAFPGLRNDLDAGSFVDDG